MTNTNWKTDLRVLVCGGRNYYDRQFLYEKLDTIHRQAGIACVIEGDATGADRLAGNWASKWKVDNEKFPADWRALGKSAGMVRNKKMLVEGKPDIVAAFPGGKGTDNMVRLAKEAGVTVLDYRREGEASPSTPRSAL